MELNLSFILDGTDYGQPVNWRQVSEAVTYDPINQVYSFSYGEEYTFIEDAYNYLYSRFTSGDICALVSVNIYANGTLIVSGNIFLSDTTFNEMQRTATASIEDAGFSSRISNNKGIEIAPIVATSKNGVAITLPTEYRTGFFDKDGISGLTSIVLGYRVHDLFEYLVHWMSDGTVQFSSDYFDTGDGKGLNISSGLNVRMHYTTNPQPPKVSFDRLFDAVRKLYNVGIGFSRSGTTWTLHIEPLSYFRNTTESTTIVGARNVELSFIKDLLYASVQVGTQITKVQDCDDGNTNCQAFVSASYYGCDEEIYAIQGECNIDSQLNLSPDNRFIYDTNTIIDIFQYQNDRYDSSIVLYDTIDLPTADQDFYCKDTDPMGLGEHWYNGDLMNNNVLDRWKDYLLGTLSLYQFTSGTGLFYADKFVTATLLPAQTPTYTTEVIDPTAVVYNPQNAWSNITNRFTAAYDGQYQFQCASGIVEDPTSPSGVIVYTQLVVEHYAFDGTLIQRYSGPLESYLTGQPGEEYEYTTPFINMDATDYCIFVIDYTQNLPTGVLQAKVIYGITVFVGPTKYGWFSCVDGRGLIQNQQINTGSALAYVRRKFTASIDDLQWSEIIADTTKAIRITTAQDGQKVGWISSIKRNFVDETAEFELITNV